MAKKPTRVAAKPAAEEAPATAAATQSPSGGAASAAPEPAAGASAQGDQAATGEDKEASLAGGGAPGGAPSNDAAVGDVLSARIRAFGEAAEALFAAHADLVAFAVAEAGAEGRRLALLVGERINQDLPLSLHRLREPSDLDASAGEGDLVEISAKSRDGKPFRRAGHLFGPDFETYRVTVEAEKRIRADAGIVVKALA